VGLHFTHRIGNQSGYPPGDVEITKFLLDSRQLNRAHDHVVALLSCVIERGNYQAHSAEDGP